VACQGEKDLHGDPAGLAKTQRAVHQLRRVLQAAERLSLPEEWRRGQRLLHGLSNSPLELQKIPKNGI
jgi:hypothetical protein